MMRCLRATLLLCLLIAAPAAGQELVNDTFLVESGGSQPLEDDYSISVRSADYSGRQAWIEAYWNDNLLMSKGVSIGGNITYEQNGTEILIIRLNDVYIGGGQSLVQVHVVQNKFQGEPEPLPTPTPTPTPTPRPTPSMPGLTALSLFVAGAAALAVRRKYQKQ